ncbi:SDR family NAD(P)-dependent oxidoreductase [Candidatus Poriferisocius sp.]|uniref:SDR family NAD(P)-dependent oxidoreductase n=1 Tax=Candidatus Poriferisocius sp. TaxID=3101276 RepID=UPI003B5BB536
MSDPIDPDGFDLTGRVALVTGAASGIGAACARRYAEAGAHVICTDVADDAGRQVADDIGGRYRHLDVADSSAWATLADELADDPGHLHVAHLNAGIMLGVGDITELTDDHYHRIIGINQHGVVFGLRAVVPLLEASGGGHALVTASMASFSPLPVDLGYSMSKHAVTGLVRSAAPGLADRGIRLNAVCPATVDTGFLGGNRARLEAAGMIIMDAEEVADAAVEIFRSGLSGECFALFAGRPAEPFRFATVPGADYRSRR